MDFLSLLVGLLIGSALVMIGATFVIVGISSTLASSFSTLNGGQAEILEVKKDASTDDVVIPESLRARNIANQGTTEAQDGSVSEVGGVGAAPPEPSQQRPLKRRNCILCGAMKRFLSKNRML